MYSEQLEQLIKSVIADGVVTEKERAVLHKKAAAEGVDEDEIDVYVDGLLLQGKQKPLKISEVDFINVTKYVGALDRTYYLGKKQYKVKNLSNPRIQTIYLNFFKDNEERLGISIAFIYKEGWQSYGEEPRLLLETDTNSIQLSWSTSSLDFPLSEKNGKSNKKKTAIVANYFDEEMLKLLCEAKQVKMSLFGCGTTTDSDYISEWEDKQQVFDIKNIPVNDLVTYAQVFYRSILDKNAYQNATIKEDIIREEVQTESFYIDDQLAIQLISGNPKKLEKISPCPSCFKQYKGVDDIIVTHVKGCAHVDYREIECRLEVLTNANGENRFYLAYISRNAKRTDLDIVVNMKSYQLRYVNDNVKHLWDYAIDEYSFFEIDQTLLKEILTTKMDIQFDSKLMGKRPKKWKEAFGYLTNSKSLEEWRTNEANGNGEGLFSKIMKLFG